ncbi:hypothetical protein [Streptomyces sp. NRRL S-118]|uniref:hypothetical protein n=1 Tax=Streptomyces sp. NRRL S-118 TaxID=1463881 RepID=UPI0004C6F22B|nr:hypothetical protein [Streptomyces sp. NRRL S-118]
MGWTVLYIAFGIVALWLLGEVLLQYKARLRWRLLAFAGFLGVVVGVLLPSVAVIIAGALAFAVGQTYVTLSFRRGFSTGWALGGSPGASRRRRSGAAEGGPTLQVTDLDYDTPEPPATPADTTAVYEPQPLPDETGQYGVYTGPSGSSGPSAAYGFEQAGSDAYADRNASYDSGFSSYAQPGYETQDAYTYSASYDYDTGQQHYASYSDPYIGPSGGPGAQPYGGYDGYGGPQPYADPYGDGAQYGTDTPPGGVWVPQQRDGEQQYPPPPPGQPSPYGYDPNDSQYRY